APEVAALLARTTPVAVKAADRKAFAFRPSSQPAPLTGQTITATFPAAASSLLPPAAADDGKDLRVLRYMPEGKVPLAPALTVTFSQPMIAVTSQDAAAASTPVKLTPTPKGRCRLLSAAEVAKDDRLSELAAAARDAGRDNAVPDDGRWLAFRATERFPSDALVTVEIPAGTPSTEGPNPTTAAQKFEFKTYAPLQLVQARCAYDDDCRPGMSFTFAFNNPLDAEKFKATQLTVSPTIDKLRVIQRGATISVSGDTKPRTTYTVTLAKDLLDEFGQTLGTPERRSFIVGDARIEKTFYGPQGMVVLDPTAKKPTLDFFTRTYSQLQVTLYQVTPADYPAYTLWTGNRWDRTKSIPVPGKKVFEDRIKTAAVAIDQLAARGAQG
nr:hypothetical protein [Deltaproteobacteria bacterium]